MRHPLTLLAWSWTFACGGPNEDDSAPADPDTDVETDTDTDTDSDTDMDADLDTDTDMDTATEGPIGSAKLRVIHVAPGQGPIDMFVNQGVVPVLQGLNRYDGTGWSERPTGTFTFGFTPENGNPATPLHTLPSVTLNADENHTFIVYTAEDGGLSVLPVIDDASGIQPTEQRIRWTHVAPGLPAFDLVELSTQTPFVDDLAPGGTYVADYGAGPMTVGLDLDGDGVVEFVFESFNLAQSAGPGKMVDIQVVSELGVPFLIAYQPNGTVARRDVLP